MSVWVGRTLSPTSPHSLRWILRSPPHLMLTRRASLSLAGSRTRMDKSARNLVLKPFCLWVAGPSSRGIALRDEDPLVFEAFGNPMFNGAPILRAVGAPLVD